jgi:hypothetical protein
LIAVAGRAVLPFLSAGFATTRFPQTSLKAIQSGFEASGQLRMIKTSRGVSVS